MVKSIFNYHVKNRENQINFENFEWDQIELFITVTELYFKKAETTKGMKIKSNDAVDWLNMLYVKPGDKYLTFEKTWKNFIKTDSRICHYLYSE